MELNPDSSMALRQPQHWRVTRRSLTLDSFDEIRPIRAEPGAGFEDDFSRPIGPDVFEERMDYLDSVSLCATPISTAAPPFSSRKTWNESPILLCASPKANCIHSIDNSPVIGKVHSRSDLSPSPSNVYWRHALDDPEELSAKTSIVSVYVVQDSAHCCLTSQTYPDKVEIQDTTRDRAMWTASLENDLCPKREAKSNSSPSIEFWRAFLNPLFCYETFPRTAPMAKTERSFEVETGVSDGTRCRAAKQTLMRPGENSDARMAMKDRSMWARSTRSNLSPITPLTFKRSLTVPTIAHNCDAAVNLFNDDLAHDIDVENSVPDSTKRLRYSISSRHSLSLENKEDGTFSGEQINDISLLSRRISITSGLLRHTLWTQQIEDESPVASRSVVRPEQCHLSISQGMPRTIAISDRRISISKASNLYDPYLEATESGREVVSEESLVVAKRTGLIISPKSQDDMKGAIVVTITGPPPLVQTEESCKTTPQGRFRNVSMGSSPVAEDELLRIPLIFDPFTFGSGLQGSKHLTPDDGAMHDESSPIAKTWYDEWTLTTEPCNCRRTNCLKRYCSCFRNQRFCDPESCWCSTVCSNTRDSEEWQNVMYKRRSGLKLGNKCTCSVIRCLKRYCVCFAAGRRCTIDCSCENCAND